MILSKYISIHGVGGWENIPIKPSEYQKSFIILLLDM
jgi:hypothetical protein